MDGLIMRETVNAAIIRNGRILLVRKEESWLLPGGKPNIGESDIGCLCREVQEELSGTVLKDVRYYGAFTGETHMREMFRIRVYLADIVGNLNRPSAEISEYQWVDDPGKYNLSDVTSKAIISLINEGYL